jgi:hypothetical protein
MRLLLRSLFPIGLFFLATGYTECDNYSEVTVPRTDRVAPAALGVVWNDATETYQHFFGPDDDGDGYAAMYIGSPGPDQYLGVSATDDGGVKELRLDAEVITHCGLFELSRIPLAKRDRQEGSPGRRVSNGVYEGFKVGDIDPDSRTVRECTGWPFMYRVEVRATITDFHGNVTVSPRYTYGFAIYN